MFIACKYRDYIYIYIDEEIGKHIPPSESIFTTALSVSSFKVKSKPEAISTLITFKSIRVSDENISSFFISVIFPLKHKYENKFIHRMKS